MLQQFLPLYERSTLSAAEKITSSTKTTVTAPLLYRIQKEGTEHYVLGHLHPIPLAYMPEEVLEIINRCSCLLTESMATLPQTLVTDLIANSPVYGPYTGFFSNNLPEEVKARFKSEIGEILQTLSTCTQPVDIENISVNLLSTLFSMFIQSRIEPDNLRIDEALIQLFKTQHKPIIELNEATKKEYTQFCMDKEQILKNQLNLNASRSDQMKGTSFLQGFASIIKKHYQNLGKQDATLDSSIKAFLQTDLACEPVVCDEETLLEVQKENKIWCDIFVKEHNKGTSNMFLACGYMHLLIPQNNMLELLLNEGFTVERVYSADQQLMKQFTPLSLSVKV